MADYELHRGRFGDRGYWTAETIIDPVPNREDVQATIFDRMLGICDGCKKSGDNQGCIGVSARNTVRPKEGSILIRSGRFPWPSGYSRCKSPKPGSFPKTK